MAQQEQSPLFSIPAELRLQIYELALSPSKQDSLGVQTGYQNPPSQLRLLETCRLVLHEAEQIFYSTNRLRLISSPQPFPDTLNARRLSAIKQLTLPVYKAEQTLSNLQLIRAKLPNLESLWLKEVSSTFTSFFAWQDLGDQLVAAMEALPHLRDARFIPHESRVPRPGQMMTVRLRIDAVCRRMCATVEATSRERAGLLTLPPELRICIYEYLLRIPNLSANGRDIPLTHHPPASPPNPTPTILSILQTCRLINSEAELIFYAINALFPADPTAFITTLTPRRLRPITTLTLPIYSAQPTLSTLRLLSASVPNLQNLCFEIQERRGGFQHQFHAWPALREDMIEAVMVCDGVREVREVREVGRDWGKEEGRNHMVRGYREKIRDVIGKMQEVVQAREVRMRAAVAAKLQEMAAGQA